MDPKIDFSKVTKLEAYLHGFITENKIFQTFLDEARSELEFYNWCKEIKETYVGMFFSEIIGIFLFKIAPCSDDIDEWIWVIVGDLPPAYLTVEDSPNPACALDSYIGAMEEWVEAVRSGESIQDLIPVNVAATAENADLLKNRLVVLDEEILSEFSDDLV